jgi:WW domain-containing oxidoreductase
MSAIFLLTQQLLPKLLKTGNARVIMLSSEAHRSPKKLDFDRLPYSQDDYSIMKAYGQAKLCNALMALELQARYGEQGLTACSVHPGNMVTTDFGRESAVMRLLFKVLSPLTKTANQGAATTVVCALHEPASDIAGLYFSHCRPHRCTSESRDAAIAAKLWQHSEAMVSDWL